VSEVPNKLLHLTWQSCLLLCKNDRTKAAIFTTPLSKASESKDIEEIVMNENENVVNDSQDIGFQWWKIWAWLGLTLGNLYILGLLSEQIGLAVVLIIVNTVLMIKILKFNKYAFLIATIISLNPLLWIINGIYLKNRWNHQKVNN
jgi:hypothetical protein